jgi:hypothetical protein
MLLTISLPFSSFGHYVIVSSRQFGLFNLGFCGSSHKKDDKRISKKNFASDQDNDNSSIVNQHLKLKISTLQNARNIQNQGKIVTYSLFLQNNPSIALSCSGASLLF